MNGSMIGWKTSTQVLVGEVILTRKPIANEPEFSSGLRYAVLEIQFVSPSRCTASAAIQRIRAIKCSEIILAGGTATMSWPN
jgi:hypothetical protein